MHSSYPALQTQVIFIHMKISGVDLRNRERGREGGREKLREAGVKCASETWIRRHTVRACMNYLRYTTSQVKVAGL